MKNKHKTTLKDIRYPGQVHGGLSLQSSGDVLLGARDGEMAIGGGFAQELGQVLKLPHLGGGKIFDPLNDHDLNQLREMTMGMHQDPNAANDAQRFIDAHINNKLNIKDLTGGLDEATPTRLL